MMEQMMMAAIGDHLRHKRHSRWTTGEDDFYRDLGDSALVRLARWLTLPRFDVRERRAPAPSLDCRGHGGRTACAVPPGNLS
ncbi:hypothetical protein [Rhizobium binxianense]